LLGATAKFDVLKHLDKIKKSQCEEEEVVTKPMIFSEYIKFHNERPSPFTLSHSQAVAQWHVDLQDPKIRKSERKMYNPKSKQQEVFTRIHVQVDELEHRRSTTEFLFVNYCDVFDL